MTKSLQERSYLLGNESTQKLLADAGFWCAKTLFGYSEREVDIAPNWRGGRPPWRRQFDITRLEPSIPEYFAQVHTGKLVPRVLYQSNTPCYSPYLFLQ